MSAVNDAVWTDDDLDAALTELRDAGLTSTDEAPRSLLGRTTRRRWIAPAAAAAAVAAVVVGAVVFGARNDQRADVSVPADALSIADGIADIGGVRFPLPVGWTVAVTDDSAVMVTACVAELPVTDCDGVTVTIAYADGPALPNSVDDAVFDLGCQGQATVVHLESDFAMGGRPAAHYWGSCGEDGALAHLWVLSDRSLAFTTPIGKWEDQGNEIVEGLDLSQWVRANGSPPMIHFTEATEAPTTG